jgi:hypothetical protein
MRRREFLRTGAVISLSTAITGCTTDSDSDQRNPSDPSTDEPGTETPGDTDTQDEQTPGDTDTQDEQTPEDTSTPEENTETEEQQTEEDPEKAVRYFFDDETGALGHLGDERIPENYDHTITNTTTEEEYQEMQRNDRFFSENAASDGGAPQGEGLDMKVDEMISRAEEIYENPEGNIDTRGYEDLNFAEEDDEIVFTRALVKASQEAGVDSSGLANIVVANIAEDAVEEIQPGFTDFKLSTLPATEPIPPGGQGHTGGVRENEFNQSFGNSGFRHMAALLQYEKDGETELKYAEQTNAVNVDIFRRVIRDPEFSLYRSSLDQDTVDASRDSEPGDSGSAFPEHYVTALDYTKARELERADEEFFRFGMNDEGGYNSLGDYLVQTMMETVDDMGVTGYDNNPDRENVAAPADGKLVSDTFGESIEDYITNPTPESRQQPENLSRGIYQIFQQEGWDTSIALTGTIEDPEILPTDQSTVNAVREDQAYDQVREKVMQ